MKFSATSQIWRMDSKAEVFFKVWIPAVDRDLIQLYICKGQWSTLNATVVMSRKPLPLQRFHHRRMNILEGCIRDFSRLSRD